jgi:hypothetical protein
MNNRALEVLYCRETSRVETLSVDFKSISEFFLSITTPGTSRKLLYTIFKFLYFSNSFLISFLIKSRHVLRFDYFVFSIILQYNINSKPLFLNSAELYN